MERKDIQYSEIVRALHDYNPTEEGCLVLKKGDLIYVQEKDATGWWSGYVGNNNGWFPSNWIEPVKKETEDITTLSRASPVVIKDDNEELPTYWRKKSTPSGQVYYFNTRTNQTTYNFNEVKHSKEIGKRSSLLMNKDGVVTASSDRPLPLQQKELVRSTSTLLTANSKITWELLINNILKAIADLNYSAKNSIKSNYIPQAAIIVTAIRDMFACSRTISTQSEKIKNNTSLATYHENIMSSLSKIVLAAKVAAGSWPPPDAVHSMRFQAGQVLLAVRHFVAVAQDTGVTLNRISDDQDLDDILSGEEFDLKGIELSDSELISKLENNTELIMNNIAALVTKITRDRVVTNSLMEAVRKTVIEIGQFLSIIEDIGVVKQGGESDIIVDEFLQKKENLYIEVNELCAASVVGDDSYTRNNALGQMLEAATTVLESVEQLLVATKLLTDHKELMHQKMIVEERSDLALLQKRADSLLISDISSNAPLSPTDSERRKSIKAMVSPQPVTASHLVSSRTSGSREGFKSPHELGSANKLQHFFGDDQNSKRSSEQNNRPWFLRKETNYDLSYNIEGAVNGGTFLALVERLTIHDQPVDPAFASAFLLTFHLFGSTKDLFKLLVERFTMQPPAGLSNDELRLWTEKKLIPIQIRVCNVLKMWIETYWIEKYDDVVLDEIHEFASTTLAVVQPQESQLILELVSRRVATDVFGDTTTTPKIKRAVRSEDYQPPILPKNLKRFTLLDVDPLEIARQLTIIEMNIFMKIKPVELMKQEWSQRNTTSVAVNIRAMSSLSTRLTGWVICTILQEADLRKRAGILKYFVKVGERCLMLNNFNTLMAIQSAFNSSTISRLNKTWDLLSAKTRLLIDQLKRATDHSRNYAEYRNSLKRSSLPCLPFLGLFLTDLTFTDDGNADFRNNGKLINFDKYTKTARIINDLMRYQTPYSFDEVPEIRNYLMTAIDDRGTRDPQELYELSLRLEPREERRNSVGPRSGSTSAGYDDQNRDLEAKIAMLQKAGML